MTPNDAKIVEMRETLGMSPREISEDLGYDEIAVKACLMQYSKVYRGECKAEELVDEEDFSKEEAAKAKRAMVELLECTEDEYVKLRVAKYIRDDKKGRLDLAKMSTVRIDITSLNQQLAEFNAKLLASRNAKSLPAPRNDDAEMPIIEVECQ